MRRDPRKYLSDMLDRAEFVSRLLADRSLADLEEDRVLRSAVERELMVLGEAIYQLHRLAPDKAEQILGWDEIIRFRHILVHGYDVLEMEVIWDAVNNDLQPLIQQLRSILSKLA
jgi:uncharacterized protein with HEPN domain